MTATKCRWGCGQTSPEVFHMNPRDTGQGGTQRGTPAAEFKQVAPESSWWPQRPTTGLPTTGPQPHLLHRLLPALPDERSLWEPGILTARPAPKARQWWFSDLRVKGNILKREKVPIQRIRPRIGSALSTAHSKWKTRGEAYEMVKGHHFQPRIPYFHKRSIKLSKKVPSFSRKLLEGMLQ